MTSLLQLIPVVALAGLLAFFFWDLTRALVRDFRRVGLGERIASCVAVAGTAFLLVVAVSWGVVGPARDARLNDFTDKIIDNSSQSFDFLIHHSAVDSCSAAFRRGEISAH